VLADYRGLTVGQMTQLRKQARSQGVYIRVVRNTLARRAMRETEYACLSDYLVGPTILAFSIEDPGAAARLIKEYTKTNTRLEVKALAVGGVAYGASEIDLGYFGWRAASTDQQICPHAQRNTEFVCTRTRCCERSKSSLKNGYPFLIN
jgi:hypothetical protein